MWVCCGWDEDEFYCGVVVVHVVPTHNTRHICECCGHYDRRGDINDVPNDEDFHVKLGISIIVKK